MKFDEFRERLESLKLKEGSIPDKIRSLLVAKKLLATSMTSQEVKEVLYERAGLTIKVNNLTSHMAPFLKQGLVLRKKPKGETEDRVFWHAAWQDESPMSYAGAFPLDEKLVNALGSDFETDIVDLELVYGRSGTCTAFMLRKILEKVTFIALSRKGVKGTKLKDSSGRYIGLENLLDLATKIRIGGLPLLSPKIHERIQGVKFLGDSAAHNYLVNISMEDIIPQLPYITLALKEISKGLT